MKLFTFSFRTRKIKDSFLLLLLTLPLSKLCFYCACRINLAVAFLQGTTHLFLSPLPLHHPASATQPTCQYERGTTQSIQAAHESSLISDPGPGFSFALLSSWPRQRNLGDGLFQSPLRPRFRRADPTRQMRRRINNKLPP